MSEITYVVVPGWKGSGPGHWQSLWAQQLAGAVRVEQDDWATPNRRDWVQPLKDGEPASASPTLLEAGQRLRLSPVGVVLAALIVGSSITLTVEGGPTLMGLPVFGLLGFLGAAVAGAWLVYSIWRSGGGR